MRCVAAVKTTAVSRGGKEALQKQMLVQFTKTTQHHTQMDPELLIITQGVIF